MHQLLREQQTIQLVRIAPADDPGPERPAPKRKSEGESTKFQLPRSDEKPFIKENFSANTYYRPSSADLPAVDSLILISRSKLPSFLLLFQIIWDTNEYNLSEGILDDINKLHSLKTAQKCYVVVTPGEIKPNIKVHKAYSGKGGGGGQPVENISVYNYSVPANVLFRHKNF